MKQTKTIFSVFPFIFRFFRCSSFFIIFINGKSKKTSSNAQETEVKNENCQIIGQESVQKFDNLTADNMKNLRMMVNPSNFASRKKENRHEMLHYSTQFFLLQ